MKILHSTTFVLSGAFGLIMGIFISPTSGMESSISEGLILGLSVGITIGFMLTFPNFGFMQRGIRQIFGEKFSKIGS